MDWEMLLLGVIALAVLVIAVSQFVMLLAGLRVVRRLDRLAQQVEKDILPVMERINAVGDDVTRATALAVAQMERADQLFARMAVRAEQVMAAGQDAVVEPLRRAVGIARALGAVLQSLRRPAGAPGGKKGAADEDQEALFIG